MAPGMKHWITYRNWPQPTPVSYPACASGSLGAREPRSPLTDTEARILDEALSLWPPKPVPAVGYPMFHVRIDEFEWKFSSVAEIDLVIDTLSQRHLPNVGSLLWWVNRLPSGATA